MLYVLHATFKAGVEPSAALHIEFSAHLMQPVLRIHLAGPLYSGPGVRSGILVIMEAPDESSARQFAEASPYAKSGIYESITINRFEPEVGSV